MIRHYVPCVHSSQGNWLVSLNTACYCSWSYNMDMIRHYVPCVHSSRGNWLVSLNTACYCSWSCSTGMIRHYVPRVCYSVHGSCNRAMIWSSSFSGIFLRKVELQLENSVKLLRKVKPYLNILSMWTAPWLESLFCSINLLAGIHCRKCFFTQRFRSSNYSRLQVRVLSLERQFFIFLLL